MTAIAGSVMSRAAESGAPRLPFGQQPERIGTTSAKTMPEASMLLNEWQPHLAVIDMDIGGDQFMQRVGSAEPAMAAR